MTRGKGIQRKQELLSATEKQGLEDSKRDLESQLKELEEFGQGTPAAMMDKAAIKKQIARIDHEIEIREPNRLTSAKRDAMLKEAKEIEEKLALGMPTRDEMNHPARYPGAVRKHLNWLKRNDPLIMRYRNIQLYVNPEEPESIENLRKDK